HLQLTRQLIPVPPQRQQVRMPQHPPHRVHVDRVRQQMRDRGVTQPVRGHRTPPLRLHPPQHPVDHRLHVPPRQPPPPPRQQQRLVRRRRPPPLQLRLQRPRHVRPQRPIPRAAPLAEAPPIA